MSRVLLRYMVGIAVSLCMLVVSFPASAESKWKCEGKVRTLVALSKRQIWSDIPIKLPPFAAQSKNAAESNASIAARTQIEMRETTVSVAYAKMSCVELSAEPLKLGKPITTIAPVKIEYRFSCHVKTTWHLGAKAGKIDKIVEIPASSEAIAMGLAILRVQEQTRILLFNKATKPTWTETDVKCQ